MFYEQTNLKFQRMLYLFYRYLFAGGRFKQVPRLFAMINVKLFTPLPAIAALVGAAEHVT